MTTIEHLPDDEKYPARYAMGGPIYDRDITDFEAKEKFEAEIAELKKPIVSFGTTEVVKDGLEVFPSGAVRGSQEGKSRIDLLDPRFILRVGQHMAEKASERAGALNYAKGIPSSRYVSGLFRHVFQYYAGDRSEDHLSAAVFNLQGLAMNEGTDLDDLYDWNA